MGLLDKLKGVFFEEEYVEVEEPVKKEKVPVAKKIETPEVKKPKEVHENREVKEENVVRVEPVKEVSQPVEKEHKFPMNFDEKDFEVDVTQEIPRERITRAEYAENREKRESVKPYSLHEENLYEGSREYSGTLYSGRSSEKDSSSYYQNNNYQGLYEGVEKKDKKQFTPSLVISPVYGILDKNYKKEEIVSRKEVRISATSSKKVDLDSVREKAYGDLATEITDSIHEKVEEEPKVSSENLLYDLSEEESPSVKVVTVGDAYEYFNDLGLEYNVDYKVEKEKAEEEKPNRRVEKKKKEKDILDDNKVIDLENDEEKSLESDSNLFDLIDSMYEDKED